MLAGSLHTYLELILYDEALAIRDPWPEFPPVQFAVCTKIHVLRLSEIMSPFSSRASTQPPFSSVCVVLPKDQILKHGRFIVLIFRLYLLRKYPVGHGHDMLHKIAISTNSCGLDKHFECSELMSDILASFSRLQVRCGIERKHCN